MNCFKAKDAGNRTSLTRSLAATATTRTSCLRVYTLRLDGHEQPQAARFIRVECPVTMIDGGLLYT
jgi:hypothetical protein